jgi:cytochrome c biogenesis protein CcmG/thiol:disulfide interchange protein DsbE
MNQAYRQKAARRFPGLAMAGLGLTLLGVAAWFLLSDLRAEYPLLSSEFTAMPAQVSFPAPVLRLHDLHGREHALADFRGQVVLVNLWATWCPPCTAEMPNLQSFYERHQADGFTVVAINDGEPAGDVVAFVEGRRLSFQVWLDPEYQATDRAFKTRNLPSSYLVDREGMVKLMWIGAISSPNLERYVSPFIKE